MAVSSFAVSTSLLIVGVVVVNNKEEIIDNVKEQIITGVSEVLPEMITGALGGVSLGNDLAPSVPDTDVPSVPGF